MKGPLPLVCFMVGSTRSGTTIIGDCLGRHTSVAHFYEPYYVWDWDMGFGADDLRPASLATPKRVRAVLRDFERFGRLSGASVILEKSPGILGIEFKHRVFPDARWIHVVRDGRDVTLSIHREWKKRERVVRADSPKALVDLVRSAFALQPYWYFRLKQLAFELKTSRSPNLLRYRNKSKWEGRAGWGPRFHGWRAVLAEGPLLAFNAHQWSECVKYVEERKGQIWEERFLEVRYEDFIEGPQESLKRMVEFLGLEYDRGFDESLPQIRAGNKGKWRDAFSREELLTIRPVVSEMLIRYGYETDSDWVER